MGVEWFGRVVGGGCVVISGWRVFGFRGGTGWVGANRWRVGGVKVFVLGEVG